jgi:hypothetical protein
MNEMGLLAFQMQEVLDSFLFVATPMIVFTIIGFVFLKKKRR